jgi:hypothetical protein
MPDFPELDLRERIVRIDQMLIAIERDLAERDRARIDVGRIEAERDRRRQEMRYQPILAMIAGLTAGAALFAAGAAFIKLFGG